MQNPTLSIVIPSFNRAGVLKESLMAMLPELEEAGIPVFFSDDSSNDETRDMVADLRTTYEHLHYQRNVPALGHDRNVLAALGLADSEYVWLIGDSMTIEQGAIARVLEVARTVRPGIIGVNARNRKIDLPGGLVENSNTVLDRFGWHLTLTGAAIFSRAAASSVRGIAPSRFRNFPQFGLTFTRLAEAPSFFWINEVCVSRRVPAGTKQESYWSRTMFGVFIDDWEAAVLALPSSYDAAIRTKIVGEHSRRAGIFGLASLVAARSQGTYGFAAFRRYRRALGVHSTLATPLLLAIAVLPKTIPRLAWRLRNWVRGRARSRATA